MAFTWSCADCDHLDKSKKNWNETHYCYQYGCKARNGYICFWLTNDKELKTGGCSNHRHTEPMQQLSLF